MHKFTKKMQVLDGFDFQKGQGSYSRKPPCPFSLFALRIALMLLVALCVWFEKIVHVCLQGVDHPCFLFEFCTFVIKPLLLFKKSLLFRLQCLQARQLFFSLHGKQCASRRLKDHKLCLVLCLEARLILRLLEGVIHGLEPLIVGDILDKRLDFTQTCFHSFQFLAGAVIGAVNILNLLLKISVLEQVVFREIVSVRAASLRIVSLALYS